MSEEPGRGQVEDLLRQMPLETAPETLWEGIQAELRRPAGASGRPLLLRPVPSRLLGAAAVIAAILGGTYVGLLRAYGAPSRWEVVPLAGAPTIDGARLANPGALEPGDWLVTDARSRAEVAVGRIGSVQVGPNTRVRLDRAPRTEHRLTLERGSLRAAIAAPPRLFFIETPSALATDLGCIYTLEVDSAGATRIHVTVGWVELGKGDRVAVVGAGFVAEVDRGGWPGTPYPHGFPAEAQAALRRLDEGEGTSRDLDLVLGSLGAPADEVGLRRRGAITLLHLLQRVEGDARTAVYERLTELWPAPPGATREETLALERPTIERWRKELSPSWSEGKAPPLVRAARRLWEWTMS